MQETPWAGSSFFSSSLKLESNRLSLLQASLDQTRDKWIKQSFVSKQNQ